MKAQAVAAPADPTIYPEEERVGEGIVQRRIVEFLRPLIDWWLNVRKGKRCLVGADQFIYYRQHDPHGRVAPDIYVLPGVDPRADVRTWKVWLEGVVPSFAFEVVSDTWEKDYYEVPERYAELGTAELVIFDPEHERRGEGVRWQVYRQVGRRGLVAVERSNGDRVRSKALGCWLRAVGAGADLRVRIAEGPRGETLVPTPEEAERAAKEAERAAKEAERAAKETAEARVAELEKELARARRTSQRR